MKLYHSILFLIIMTLFSCSRDSLDIASVKEGKYQLNLSQTPEEPLPGNRIVLNYSITGPTAERIVYPEIGEWENLEIVSWDKNKKGGILTLISKKGGQYNIPEIAFLLEDKNQQREELKIPSWTLTVKNLADQNSPMKENLPMLSLGVLKSWQWALLLFLLLLVILIVGYFLIYRKKRNHISIPLSQVLENYRKELDLNRYLTDWEPQKFYLHLTEALRYFIDSMFGLKSSGQTSKEYLPEFLKLPVFKSREYPWLIGLIDRADQIKYANAQSMQEQMMADLEQAESLFKYLVDYQKEREHYETT